MNAETLCWTATEPNLTQFLNKSRTRESTDNNNPLGSVIGNALIAHESVKARLSLLSVGRKRKLDRTKQL